MDESLLRNHLNCTYPICVPLKNNGILEYAHSPNSTPLPVPFYLPQTKSFCSRGGGGWYPSMPCRSPGPHPGGRSRGLVGWGSPGPHPGEVEGSGWGGLQAHTQGCVSQHALRQTPPPPADGYCCGRYASYWNAFLFSIFLDRKCEQCHTPSHMNLLLSRS